MSNKFALVRDGAVVEIREFHDLTKVAVNKLDPNGERLLRPFTDAEPPEYDPRTHTIIEGFDIQADGVARTWRVQLRDVAARVEFVRGITRQKIEGGFWSSALGAPHYYPSNETDQQNIAANVVSSILPEAADPAWTTYQLCADNKGVWAYRTHAAAQIQQVGRDGKAHVMACLLNGARLRASVEAGGAPDMDSGWP